MNVTPQLCRIPPKQTSKGKEKIGSSTGTARTQVLEGMIQLFLIYGTAARYENIVSRWIVTPERAIKLENFQILS